MPRRFYDDHKKALPGWRRVKTVQTLAMNHESPPRVLIVGAGAAGMVTGYLFSLSGADVTFFVRPSRMVEMADKPKKLYCYDDLQQKHFDAYDCVCELKDVADRRFDYVLTTQDGTAMHSEEGKQFLRDLGDATRDSDAILVCLGVAQDIEAYFAECTNIPSERLLFGAFSFFSHNVPLPEQTMSNEIDQTALAESVFGYVHQFGDVGLIMTRSNKAIGKVFAEAFSRSGVSTCSVLPDIRFSDSMGGFPFPAMVACVIEGWPEHEEMYRTDTWALASRATKEVVTLPQFGMLAKIVGLFWGPLNLLTRAWRQLDAATLPLDFRAFNKFHHGEKVVEQDIQLLRDILIREEGRGQKLPNLRALLGRLDATRSTR